MQQRASSEGDLRFFQNLAYLVPGYRGYQDAALRRGEDSRLRARLLAAIKALRDEIHTVREAWEDAEAEGRWIHGLDERAQEMSRISEDLRYCPPRADAFFLQPNLPGEILDELLGADLVLLGDLDVVAGAIEALPENPPRRKGMRKLLDDLQASIHSFAVHLLHRDGILCRVDPNPTGTPG